MSERAFLINQTVEMYAVNDVYRYEQPFEYGDGGAHEWRVTVRRNRQIADLTGMTARCLVTRAANSAERERGIATVSVYMDAEVNAEAGIISCVFDAGCYAGSGAVSCAMCLSGEDGQTTTVARMSARTQRTASDVLADPDDLVMGLAEIEAVAKEVRETSAEVSTMLAEVQTEQASWVGATAQAETLEPGSEATFTLGKDENGSRVFKAGIPKGEKGDKGVPGAVYTQFAFVATADGWTQDTNGVSYSQTIAVEDLPNAPGTLYLNTDNVSAVQAEAMQTQYALIWSANTYAGGVHVTALAVPDRDIPLIVGVFAWEG